jgi:large conductance mechanosensitive channel
VDFTALTVKLGNQVGDMPPPEIRYGTFLQTVLDFLIVAFAIFMAVKAMNKMKRKQEAAPPPAPPAPTAEVQLLTEIRDSLKRG